MEEEEEEASLTEKRKPVTDPSAVPPQKKRRVQLAQVERLPSEGALSPNDNEAEEVNSEETLQKLENEELHETAEAEKFKQQYGDNIPINVKDVRATTLEILGEYPALLGELTVLKILKNRSTSLSRLFGVGESSYYFRDLDPRDNKEELKEELEDVINENEKRTIIRLEKKKVELKEQKIGKTTTEEFIAFSKQIDEKFNHILQELHEVSTSLKEKLDTGTTSVREVYVLFLMLREKFLLLEEGKLPTSFYDTQYNSSLSIEDTYERFLMHKFETIEDTLRTSEFTFTGDLLQERVKYFKDMYNSLVSGKFTPEYVFQNSLKFEEEPEPSKRPLLKYERPVFLDKTFNRVYDSLQASQNITDKEQEPVTRTFYYHTGETKEAKKEEDRLPEDVSNFFYYEEPMLFLTAYPERKRKPNVKSFPSDNMSFPSDKVASAAQKELSLTFLQINLVKAKRMTRKGRMDPQTFKKIEKQIQKYQRKIRKKDLTIARIQTILQHVEDIISFGPNKEASEVEKEVILNSLSTQLELVQRLFENESHPVLFALLKEKLANYRRTALKEGVTSLKLQYVLRELYKLISQAKKVKVSTVAAAESSTEAAQSQDVLERDDLLAQAKTKKKGNTSDKAATSSLDLIVSTNLLEAILQNEEHYEEFNIYWPNKEATELEREVTLLRLSSQLQLAQTLFESEKPELFDKIKRQVQQYESVARQKGVTASTLQSIMETLDNAISATKQAEGDTATAITFQEFTVEEPKPSVPTETNPIPEKPSLPKPKRIKPTVDRVATYADKQAMKLQLRGFKTKATKDINDPQKRENVISEINNLLNRFENIDRKETTTTKSQLNTIYEYFNNLIKQAKESDASGATGATGAAAATAEAQTEAQTDEETKAEKKIGSRTGPRSGSRTGPRSGSRTGSDSSESFSVYGESPSSITPQERYTKTYFVSGQKAILTPLAARNLYFEFAEDVSTEEEEDIETVEAVIPEATESSKSLIEEYLDNMIHILKTEPSFTLQDPRYNETKQEEAMANFDSITDLDDQVRISGKYNEYQDLLSPLLAIQKTEQVKAQRAEAEAMKQRAIQAYEEMKRAGTLKKIDWGAAGAGAREEAEAGAGASSSDELEEDVVTNKKKSPSAAAAASAASAAPAAPLTDAEKREQLEKLTVKQLKEIAERNGCTVYRSLNKPKLIDKIIRECWEVVVKEKTTTVGAAGTSKPQKSKTKANVHPNSLPEHKQFQIGALKTIDQVYNFVDDNFEPQKILKNRPPDELLLFVESYYNKMLPALRQNSTLLEDAGFEGIHSFFEDQLDAYNDDNPIVKKLQKKNEQLNILRDSLYEKLQEKQDCLKLEQSLDDILALLNDPNHIITLKSFNGVRDELREYCNKLEDKNIRERVLAKYKQVDLARTRFLRAQKVAETKESDAIVRRTLE